MTDPTPPAEATPGGESPTTTEGASAEAAKYRRRLREVETERDTLAGHLGSARLGLLQAATADLRVKGTMQLREEAFTDAITDVAEFFGDDGNLDREALQGHLDEVFASKAHYFEHNASGTFIVPEENGMPKVTGEAGGRGAFERAFRPQSPQ
ncbi:hypothetical protein [Pseudolysinimonas sp.]